MQSSSDVVFLAVEVVREYNSTIQRLNGNPDGFNYDTECDKAKINFVKRMQNVLDNFTKNGQPH